MQEEGQEKDTTTHLCWTDGRTTKYTEPSYLVHGWTEEWVKYLDYISKIDLSHRQRLRYERTLHMRCADSNKQAGPQCQRPDCKSSADALVSLQRAQGKGFTSYSDAFEDKTKYHTGSRNPTTLGVVEFQLEDVLLVTFIRKMDRKPNVVEFFILGPSLARMALSRVARQRMAGPAITTTTPGSRSDQPQETVGERKGLNCCQVHLNPESICNFAHFSDFSFWQFRVQPVATAMNATEMVYR